jgi:hypothetical protein
MTYRALELPARAGESLQVFGVPFRVTREAGRVTPIPYGQPLAVNAQARALFFLGMVTQVASGEIGWIGERHHAFQNKLYLGDLIGRINLLYEGNQLDVIPLIFGVNVWNYETFTPLQPHEGKPFPMFAPYREPFDSDPAARALLDDSLLLRENPAGEKFTRYVFALHLRDRPLEQVTVAPWGSRSAGVGISAITALTGEGPAPDQDWRFTDERFFLQRRYYPAVDRLARRLYQFLDDLPATFPPDLPAEYTGPRVELGGTPEAELLTNVYHHNIHDMATQKVEADGTLHTSTRDAPCYGFYTGIGTYRPLGIYHTQIWSRDIGRLLCEVIEHGERERCVKAADKLLRYLYNPSPIFQRPHWKRIVNATDLGIWPESYEGITFDEYVKGRENDGHASLMLMFYRLYQHGVVDRAYLQAHRRELEDAAEWLCWQMDTPAESGFDGVLCSESESTYERQAGYDLYSNAYVLAALRAFVRLGQALGDERLTRRWQEHADRLQVGIEQRFVTTHPRHGKVWCEPETNNWPSELKRLASLMLMAEMDGYDPAQAAPDAQSMWANTYQAQKETFFSPMMGGSMGYGQGFVTQTALLLDQVEDYTECLKWAARFSYHHTEHHYLVPEGVTYHPSGRFWYRHTDLANAFQQTEIIKCVRLVLGLDDLRPDLGLRLVPRLPDGWQRIGVRDYPIAVASDSGTQQVRVNWTYQRLDDGGYEAALTAERPIRVATIRVGPFPLQTRAVRLEGSAAPINLRRSGTRLFADVALNVETDNVKLRVLINPT